MTKQTPLTYDQLHKLPKIDLHRHLEGSLRLDTLTRIADEHGLALPSNDLEALRPHVQMVNDPHDPATFLAKFGVLRHFYQSPEVVARLAYEAIVDAAVDNVRYLELRFSPQALARVRGFPLADVMQWVINATTHASEVCDIEIGLIVTLLRHESVELAEQVAQLAFDHYGNGVVGIDIAGDEITYPADPFLHLFEQAREIGMGITVHAGEWVNAEAVRYAVEKLHTDRIGHGIRTLDDPEIVKLVRQQEITLEVCPTSNLHTGTVPSLAEHPLPKLLKAGLLVTLNTDDPCVSNSHLTDEYWAAVQHMQIGYPELRQMTLNAAQAAFLPPEQQQRLIQKFARLLPEQWPQ